MANERLKSLISKLENRRPDSRGYITCGPEAVDILNHLSTLVPVGIYVTSDDGDMMGIEIKIGFHLSREELNDADSV